MTTTDANVSESRTERAAKWGSRRQSGGPGSSPGDAVYALGMLGALAYFARSASSAKEYLQAFAMASVWPALLVYRAFRRLDE
jgi:hypothetical protein